MKNKPYSLVLCILFLLFCFRVFAQLAQYVTTISFLPSFEAWHSGTLAYGTLVCFQVAIILIYLRICIKISNGTAKVSQVIGKRLIILGGVYAFVMVVRYILRMSMFPSERWFGGSIPILFHIVLATFLITLGIYHFRNGAFVKSSKPIRFLWTSLYVFVFISILIWLSYQLAPFIIAKKIQLRPSEYSVNIEKKVPITMGDGAILFADIYHPEKLNIAPTILVRIPLDDNAKGKIMSNVVGRLWAERGYNVMIQGVRGRFGSTDDHIPFTHEREDGISTLQWLNKQPWHNGKTGMWGGSYFGYTQWVIADQDSLGLSALLTQISSSSNYKMFHPGNAFAFESALFWAARSHSEKDTPMDYESLIKGYNGAPLIKADDRTVGDTPFYNDWVIHDQKDAYWQAVDGTDRVQHLTVPIMMMAGWYDPYLPSQVDDYENLVKHGKPEVAQKSRLIIGPWAHAETVVMPNGYKDQHYRLASIGPAINWYDVHLSQKKKADYPRVRIFVMGINQWRDEGAFPLERTIYTAYYLSMDKTNTNQGILSASLPAYDSSIYEYTFDPANPLPSIGGSVLGFRAGAKNQNEIMHRDDVVIYTSPVLEHDIEVTGKIKLMLHVATDAKSTDFTAKLCDVYPDKKSYNLSDGILRKEYRKKSEEIEIELNPTSNVFLKGHCIRLIISSSNYPRYSLNYNTGTGNYNEEKGLKAHQKVYTGKVHSSRLILPVIRGE